MIAMLAPLLDALRSWFQSPAWLLLAIPAFALVIVDVVRRWGNASVGRRLLGGVVRFAILGSLIVALADPRWHEHDDVAQVIFVVDRSASISDDALDESTARATAMAEALGPEVDVGLVLFDATAEVAVLPGSAWAMPAVLRSNPVDATDIDSALNLALGLVVAQGGGDIVLLTDGRATATGPTSAIAQARERGIAVHTVPIAPSKDDPAVGAIVLASGQAQPGAAVSGHVELDGASEATRGTLTIKLGEEVIATESVELEANKALRVPFSHELDARTEPGPLPITATLRPNREDANPQNNDARASVMVTDPPLVRIFAGEEHDGTTLARALRAERMDVQVVAVDDLKPQHEQLDDVDLVVLANAPAAAIGGSRALQPEFLGELARYVDNGGGLLVLGGPQSYDMGGYGQSKLDRVLPVEIDPVDPEIQSGATMIIVLDRSGSMSARVGWGKSKMELADEGAAASINLLRPFDRVGVMSVTETVRWEVATQAVRDVAALKRKVMKIRADGGGIFVYTALEAAYAALDKVDTPLKHVILFSDAADSEEQIKGIPFSRSGSTATGLTAEALAAKRHARGVTTSVIGIGTNDDLDTAFLKRLAKSGGGRFYLTADATKLRGLFVEETERLVDSSLHEVKFRPVPVRSHPIVDGIDYVSAPPLSGYQELDPRPTAEVILEGPDGHPILTTWRYGLGQVVAWASDGGPRWSQSWLTWSGYAQQWTQAARFALRSHVGDDTAVEVGFAGGQAQLKIARRDNKGLTIDDGAVRARIVDQSGNAQVALTSLEPGLWEGEAPVEQGRSYTVEVLGKDDEILTTHQFTPPPSDERRFRSADEPWLRSTAETTDASYDPDFIEPKLAEAVTTEVHPLWPWALLFAILLLPIDATLRRPARVV